MPPAFQNFLRGLWPSDAAGTCDPLSANERGPHFPSSESPGILMIGMLGLVGRRRKISAQPLRRTLLAACAYLACITLVGACAAASDTATVVNDDGCPNGSTAPSQTGSTQNCTCPPNIPGDRANQNLREQLNCPSPLPPGSGAIVGSLIGGARASHSANEANLVARSTVSRDPTVTTMADAQLASGDHQAAIAGDIAPDGMGNVATGIAVGVGNRSGADGAGDGKHGAGNGGNGSGSAIGLTGGLKTADAKDTTLGVAGGPQTGTGGSSIYQNGAGVANQAGGDSNGMGGTYGRGVGLAAGEGGSVTDTAFGVDAGAENKAQGGDDPTDYFTRLGLEDNLFKVVERRYRERATHWVTDDLKPRSEPPSPAGLPAKKTDTLK